MKKIIVISIFLTTAVFSQLPHTFVPGTVARADSVNANFQFLLNKIVALEQKNDSLAGLITVLNSKSVIYDSTDSVLSLRLSILETTAELPVGTVIAAMTPLDTLNEIWALADGRAATTAYFEATGNSNIPDLRGMFLRGLNAGRDDGLEDPEGEDRVPGNYQADEVKSHNHNNGVWNKILRVTGNWTAGSADNTSGEPDIKYPADMLAFGGSETRSKNSAIYWYVKVK